VAGARVFAVVPGDLDGDGWDQDAAMAVFLADLEAGYDLFTSPVGLDPNAAYLRSGPGERALVDHGLGCWQACRREM